ncbi:MAG: hypothetical protein MHM6MM_008986 [Cercozoa sp. M6MM]
MPSVVPECTPAYVLDAVVLFLDESDLQTLSEAYGGEQKLLSAGWSEETKGAAESQARPHGHRRGDELLAYCAAARLRNQCLKSVQRVASQVAQWLARGRKKRRKQVPHVRRPCPCRLFRSNSRVLEIGAGDFSFAESLVREGSCIRQAGGVLCATTPAASREVTEQRHAQSAEHMRLLQRREVTLLFGLDVALLPQLCDIGVVQTRAPFIPTEYNEDNDSPADILFREASDYLNQLPPLPPALRRNSQQLCSIVSHAPFTDIVFNFPHFGDSSRFRHGEYDLESVRQNRLLLAKFLLAVACVPGGLLHRDGQVHVTVKTTGPFRHWRAGELFSARSCPFRVHRQRLFCDADFPAYTHRQTRCNSQPRHAHAKTWIRSFNSPFNVTCFSKRPCVQV